MSTLTSLLQLQAQKELDKKGLQIFVKSSISPEVKVYDSDKTNLNGGGGSASFVDVGITIRDRNGNLITNYGGQPKTNYLLTGSIVAFVLMVAFFFGRGVIK